MQAVDFSLPPIEGLVLEIETTCSSVFDRGAPLWYRNGEEAVDITTFRHVVKRVSQNRVVGVERTYETSLTRYQNGREHARGLASGTTIRLTHDNGAAEIQQRIDGKWRTPRSFAACPSAAELRSPLVRLGAGKHNVRDVWRVPGWPLARWALGGTSPGEEATLRLRLDAVRNGVGGKHGPLAILDATLESRGRFVSTAGDWDHETKWSGVIVYDIDRRFVRSCAGKGTRRTTRWEGRGAVTPDGKMLKRVAVRFASSGRANVIETR